MKVNSSPSFLFTANPPARPSLAMLLCALVALATLFLTAASRAWLMPALVLPTCAIVIIWAHGWPRKWPHDSNLPNIVRLIGFPLLFVFGNRARLDIDWIFSPSTLFFLGTLTAIELTLQLWREPAPAAAGELQTGERFPAICFLLVCAVFLSGSNTNFGGYITWATPLFWALLLWALLDWRLVPTLANPPQPKSSPTKSPHHNARQRPLAHLAVNRLAAVFLLGALGGGALLSGLTLHFKEELMQLGSQLVRDRMPQTAGISNRPQLGSRFEVPDSPQRILRIEGALAGPHLRAASFDYYEDGGWLPAANQRRTVTLSPQELGGDASGPRTLVTRLLDTQGNLLFAPLNAAGLIPGQGTDIDGVTVDGDLESGLLRCEEVAPFRYEIVDNAQNVNGVLSHQGPFAAPLTRETRDKYLQLPSELDSRVRDLALSITKTSLHPAQSAEMIAEYLMSNHSYSRNAQRGAGDPVTNFLLDKRNAHCEYFASAMAILARCNRIPSRYVVGYLAHESALGANSKRGAVTVVRQRDAHAWAELWIEGVGWVTADATPGDGTPERFGNAPPWQRAYEWAQDTLENIRERAVQTPKRTWAIIIGIPLGLWILIRARPTSRRQNATKSWQYATDDERLNILASRFENWMAREHWMCPPSQSWRTYFAQIERAEVLNWIAAYERARFGFDHTQSQLNDLEHSLSALENAPHINASTPALKGTP